MELWEKSERTSCNQLSPLQTAGCISFIRKCLQQIQNVPTASTLPLYMLSSWSSVMEDKAIIGSSSNPQSRHKLILCSSTPFNPTGLTVNYLDHFLAHSTTGSVNIRTRTLWLIIPLFIWSVKSAACFLSCKMTLSECFAQAELSLLPCVISVWHWFSFWLTERFRTIMLQWYQIQTSNKSTPKRNTKT